MSTYQLIKLFVTSGKGAGEDFASELARRAIKQLPGPISGQTILDLGAGPCIYSESLRQAGAIVVSSEIDIDELLRSPFDPERPLVADGRELPFRDRVFDGVVCSNVLEHTPDPFTIIDEIGRVLKFGGWSYISWTNWLSPWGGHAVAPLHYLGAQRSVKIWKQLFGNPRGKNLPFSGVWPTYIGRTIRYVRTHPRLELVDAYPRYWSKLKIIMKIPGLREVFSWNCVLIVRVKTQS